MQAITGTRTLKVAAAAMAFAITATALQSSALAQPRDWVVAESRYGKGTVSGPVRPWRHGWQVRLPGGTWVDCVKSCSDTLRRQTVDFWDNQGPAAKDAGPGYFRWEFGF